MRLAVISHKICFKNENSPSGYATDGGFTRQIGAISELFDETEVIVPCAEITKNVGLTSLVGKEIKVRELSVPSGNGLKRKLAMPFWFLRNAKIIWRKIKSADAVHAPIPGDVGTIGFIFALLQKKPLFVRYCGNWLVERTNAEKFWKWLMEKFAGGRNVMLATGGTNDAPSKKNPHIKWIFSTSLRQKEIEQSSPRELPKNGEIKLLIACRQEKGKGTEIIIESLPEILKRFPNVELDVVGDGAMLVELKKLAENLDLKDKVIFHGKVEQKRVVELMKKAHVFCFPTASEGFPKVVLEALACGLPVITTCISVLPKLIENGNGILLDKPTVETLASAVVEVCSDAGKYKEMSVKAIETARQYSLEKWRDEIAEHLRRAWNVASLFDEKRETVNGISPVYFAGTSAKSN